MKQNKGNHTIKVLQGLIKATNENNPIVIQGVNDNMEYIEQDIPYTKPLKKKGEKSKTNYTQQVIKMLKNAQRYSCN